MPGRIRVVGSLLLTSIAVTSAAAQGPLHTLRGTATDSLTGAPLAQAFVILQGTQRGVVADAQGRFVFDSLSAGEYTIALQHPALDSAGLSGLQRTVRVPGADVVIATPSFATLWRIACGNAPAPRDSGFAYGTVRDAASGRPLRDALVRLSWFELRKTNRSSVEQRAWNAQARTDASGTFGICGIPLDATLHIQASLDSAASGIIEVLGRRALRSDLSLDASGLARFGVIAGVITDSSGRPISGARTMTENAETRSDAAGRFVLRGVPTGTRQVRMVAIGHTMASATVDVTASDTAYVAAMMGSVQQLEAINVAARTPYVQLITRGIEERKRTGTGFFIDSMTLASHGTLAGALRLAPAVRMRGRGLDEKVMFPVRVQRLPGEELCEASIWIDGRKSEQSFLAELRPADIAMIEVYPRFLLIPVEYMARYEGCGVVAVWTKRSLY